MSPVTLCRVLHAQYKLLMEEYDRYYYTFWYDHVYTPIVKELQATYTQIDLVKFSWCVATGEEWK